MLTTDDLVAGDDAWFAATGITDGELPRGVRYGADRVTTESIVMRARGDTVHVVRSRHRLDRRDAGRAAGHRRPDDVPIA